MRMRIKAPLFLCRLIPLCTRLCGLIPLRIGKWLGISLGLILEHVFRANESIIKLQIKRAYLDTGKKSESECLEIQHAYYRHIGLLFTEDFRILGGCLQYLDSMVEWEGEEHLNAALKRGKGVFLLNGHIGNWELAGAALIRRGYPATAIARDVRGRFKNELKNMLREATAMPTYGDKKSIKGILKGLKRNEVIVSMLDRNVKPPDGAFVDFFGYPASTFTSLAILASRSGAAIVPGCIYRKPDGITHKCVIWPEIELEFPYDDQEMNIIHNTQRFTRQLETMIDKCPSQWLWHHRRWKSRPKDETQNPFDYRNGDLRPIADRA